jgi:hypothetical protein
VIKAGHSLVHLLNYLGTTPLFEIFSGELDATTASAEKTNTNNSEERRQGRSRDEGEPTAARDSTPDGVEAVEQQQHSPGPPW